MQGKQRALLRSSIVAILLVPLTQAFWNMSGKNIIPAHAENNGAAPTPFMGWSTWNFDAYYPTESNVEAQANVEASKLKAYGYNYVLLDDFWYVNPSTNVDANGYWVSDSRKFPNGLASLASYVRGLGLKVGFYLTPGIPVAAVKQNTPIVGTSYHARDIADTSHYETNYNYGGTATTITFHGTNDGNWNVVQSMTTSVQLNTGNNTILFSNASASGPDIDRITVS